MDLTQIDPIVFGRLRDMYFPMETNYEDSVGAPYFNTWFVLIDGKEPSRDVTQMKKEQLKYYCFRCKNQSHRTCDCMKTFRVGEVGNSELVPQRTNVVIGTTGNKVLKEDVNVD